MPSVRVPSRFLAGTAGLGVALLSCGVAADPAAPASSSRPAVAAPMSDYTADGRLPLASLQRAFDLLATPHGWLRETVHVYPDDASLAISAWRTPQRGEALWLLAGIHGEEPAGPNAIAPAMQVTRVAATQRRFIVTSAARSRWRAPTRRCTPRSSRTPRRRSPTGPLRQAA